MLTNEVGPVTSTPKTRYTVPAVEKAFAILELLVESPKGLRMVDVARELQLPKTSTFVTLRVLERLGYLNEVSDNRYCISLKLFELGAKGMVHTDLVGTATRHLESLSARTGHTTHLAVLDRAEVMYVAKVDAPGFVKFDTYVGKRAVAHVTAVGKAMLAQLSSNELDPLLEGISFDRGTAKAAHSIHELRQVLSEIKSRGYAVDDEEEVQGVRCIAAPIRSQSGLVVAAVGLIGLTSTLTDSFVPQIGAEVVEAARMIGTDLVNSRTADLVNSQRAVVFV